MVDIPLQDLDNIRYPKRRPWVILLAVLAIGGIWLWKEHRSADPPVDADSPIRQVQQSPASVTETVAPATNTSAASNRSVQPKGIPTGRQKPALVSPPVPTMMGPAVTQLVQRARAAEARAAQNSSAFAEARRLYLDAFKAGADSRTRAEIEPRLGELNVRLALSPLPMPGVKTEYVVKSGDSVARIAARLGVTTSLIEHGNLIANADRIRAGDHYHILTGDFAIAVSKLRKDLLVTLNGEFFKRYAIATGKFGKTPTGTFEIRDKIVQPPWWRPDGKEVPYGDPENILGTRWMAIRATGSTPDVRGYGIHGTWEDASIGQESSAGCIRMLNADVEELYQLVPMRTPVTITE